MGGCFFAMRMGCFLIFVAPKDYWMLGLCTSHAFFSLLNVLFTLMGVEWAFSGRSTMGLCLICVAIVCLFIEL